MENEMMPEPEFNTRSLDERVDALYKLYGFLARSVGQLRTEFESYVKTTDRQDREYDAYLDVRIAEVEYCVKLLADNALGGSRGAE